MDDGDAEDRWSERALAACLEHLRTSTATEAHEVRVTSAWTDGPTAFCVVYRNPYFDGLIGLRRDATDARTAIEGRRWNRNLMTSGYDMADGVVLEGGLPDAAGFGRNVADFDIGEPHAPADDDAMDNLGVSWHGNLAYGVPARP